VIVFVVMLVVMVVMAGLVLAYAARPTFGAARARGRTPAKVAEAVAQVEERLAIPADAPVSGLLGSREAHQRVSQRFERLEQRISGTLRPRSRADATRLSRPGGPGGLSRGRSTARGSRKGH